MSTCTGTTNCQKTARFFWPTLYLPDVSTSFVQKSHLLKSVWKCGALQHHEPCCFKGVGHFEAKFQVEGLLFALTFMYRQIGEWPHYNFAGGSFYTKKLCSRLYSIEFDVYSKTKTKNAFEPPFLDLRVTHALHLQLAGKPVVDFIFVIIELFRYLLRLRRYKRKSVEVGVSRRGITLSANFSRKRASPTNHCWCQSSRVIALSCGIKIYAVHHLDLSQSTRVTDRRQTELRHPRPPSRMLAR